MSDLGFNKIAFCILGTGLALIGLNEASHSLFHTAHHEKPGYLVDVPEVHAGGGERGKDGDGEEEGAEFHRGQKLGAES